MKRMIALAEAICIVVSFSGCSKKTDVQIISEKNPMQESKQANVEVKSTEEFIRSLEKSGYEVKAEKQDEKGFLTGTLTIVKVGKEAVGVHEYGDNAQMEQDAGTIRADGSMIGNTIYEFKSKPHFYKRGNIIASYIGEDKDMVKELERLLGKQFAGGE